MGEMTVKSTAYAYIEDILGEGEKGGILATLSAVYNDIDQLSQNAESSLYREQLVQDAVTLTNVLNVTASNLYEYQQEMDDSVKRITEQINSLARQIADLNDSIFKYELSGYKANDLRDQRNLLVDQLSGLTSVTVGETSDGRYSVSIGGVSLVSHTTVHEIELRADTVNPVTGDTYVSPYWMDSGIRVDAGSGTLRAALDIRDGNSVSTPGIPYYLAQLDALAGSLVQEFNAVNRAGYTLPYDAGASRTGVDFFDPSKVHAFDITLSDALLESGCNIAASSAEVAGTDNWGNNENLSALLSLRDAANLTSGGVALGNHESFMRAITTGIAVTAGYYADRSDTQQTLTDAISGQRLSVSGVSMDEETVNLIRYQQSYQAAAKLISVIDEMLSTIIKM
jgi:flagellar hook-associated protein 1 FlgK